MKKIMESISLNSLHYMNKYYKKQATQEWVP